MKILASTSYRGCAILRAWRFWLLVGLCQLSAGALAAPQWNESFAERIDANLSKLMQESGVVGMARTEALPGLI